MDALGDTQPISSRLRSQSRRSERAQQQPLPSTSPKVSEAFDSSDEASEWSGAGSDEEREPNLRRAPGFVTHSAALSDVDGFAGIFPLGMDVSELKGIPDRISLCGRASNRAKVRGLFDPDHFKQFGIANPERMQGAGFALQRNKHGLTSHHIGELILRTTIDPAGLH